MPSVRVKKADLLQKLKTNRAAHRAVFEAAQEAFRGEVIRRLDHMLTEAKAGRRIGTSVMLKAPIDQTKEYDRAVTQVEMEVRDQIELSDHEFAQLVMDDWSWKGQVMALNSSYVDPGEAVVDRDGLSFTSARPKAAAALAGLVMEGR